MSNKEEQEYLELIENIITNGIDSTDRTGVGTRYLIGQTLKYDLSDNKIPIWTTRKIKWANQVWELIWFLRGQTDIKWLQDRGVNIWNSWVKEDGTIGPGYGKQWRHWAVNDGGSSWIDQFLRITEQIKTNPESRRHIVSLWNVAEVDDCALPPCHGDIIQFIVEKNKYLHCIQYQRSADMILGYCPWQYALLTNIIAKLTGLEAKSLTVTVGNAHVYNNQLDGAKEQLKRMPTQFPVLEISENIKTIESVEESCLEDYKLVGYNHQSFIKFPIAV